MAIRFGLKGLNSTIATGFTASLDALGYAVDMLRLGRVQALLVGGVEELCIQTFLGFYKLGFLATAANGTPPPYAPLGNQPGGALLGEGAAFLMLELLEDARARKAEILGEIAATGSLFHPASMYRYDAHAQGAITVLREALQEAKLTASDVDLVSVSANSTKSGDATVEAMLAALFDGDQRRPEIGTPKTFLGEAFSASGALACAAALGATRHKTALVEGGGPTGISSAVVLKLGACA